MAATTKTSASAKRVSVKTAANTNSRAKKKQSAKKKPSAKKASVKKTAATKKATTRKRSTTKRATAKATGMTKAVRSTAKKSVAAKKVAAKKQAAIYIDSEQKTAAGKANWKAAQIQAKRDLKNTANNNNVKITDQKRVPSYGGKPIPTEKHALAKMFLPLVKDVAAHISRRLPAHVLYEDLLSAGHFGLASAIDRFDPERRETFKGYAEFRIRGAIKDELRRQDMMSRDARIESKAVKRRVDALELKLGRKPSDDEVAKLLDVSLEEYRAMQLKLISVQVVSSECFYVSDNRELPEDIASKNELKTRIENALSMLPTRQADIVRKIYLEDKPLKDIAANMNVSSSRVCQIRNDAAKKLKGLLSDFRPTGS